MKKLQEKDDSDGDIEVDYEDSPENPSEEITSLGEELSSSSSQQLPCSGEQPAPREAQPSLNTAPQEETPLPLLPKEPELSTESPVAPLPLFLLETSKPLPLGEPLPISSLEKEADQLSAQLETAMSEEREIHNL